MRKNSLGVSGLMAGWEEAGVGKRFVFAAAPADVGDCRGMGFAAAPTTAGA